MLNLKFENQLHQKGFELVAGVDEVGRGAWAGPLVAAAVILPRGKCIQGVRDSKLLTPRAREELYQEIIDQAITFKVARVSHGTIDKIGLGQANLRVLRSAYQKLSPQPHYLLVDAYNLGRLKIPYQSIIRGDRLVYSIAAASIIAKVTRDRLMIKYDQKFLGYYFSRHKGYGTKLHREKIKEHGLCELHRRSFKIS